MASKSGIIGIKEALQAIERMQKNLPIENRKGSEELAEYASEIMRRRVRVWRGKLKTSIRAVKTDADTSSVKMLFYGPILEKGGFRVGSKVPPRLKQWSHDKGYSPSAMEGKYIKPHPFIAPALKDTRKQVSRVQKQIIQRSREK